MLNFLTLILIFAILSFLLIFKSNSVLKKLRSRKMKFTERSPNHFIKKNIKSEFISNYNNPINSSLNRAFYKLTLRDQMLKLFKGNKTDKLESLKIAAELSDQSSLKLLKMGLKDMDPDIVKFSAEMIRRFK